MTRDELIAQIDQLIEADHDYNTSADAAVAAAVAAFNYVAGNLGLTGFQGEWAALKAYREILHIDGPFGVVRGENMLYPQYDEVAKVERWQQEWSDWLREKAAEKIASAHGDVHPAVLEHWRRLAAAEAAS